MTRAYADVVHAVMASIDDGTRGEPYRGHSNPLRGQCYVVAEAIWHLLGGRRQHEWYPWVGHVGLETHWFLAAADSPNPNIDPTWGQYARVTTAPLVGTRRCGFLTRQPSRRARRVIRRARKLLNGTG